ncbi:MAG: SMC-Scp complex subunit ScpB [Ignavibacteria bacterium]|nr:SMC-Scp complex subunit ScpB [Ignavibacteria bacterium]MBT8381798.1 SMC-Scp complex subunit ScpB [Ignavibacteria bacterium]MBT8392610.1 SMC-Scp complex subunit ScpB [Ignavibacteria bacterium]NNJ51631.1 SMC-Scp complex subunit ScpB [Ignavibacteriaceae bacterium]NNL20305.1 SMC-Scp complex subunit ScpB [Ignavibacteriaceae bacterium]
MDSTYTNVIEALIFSSDDSLSSEDIISSIRGIDGEDVEITKEDIDIVIDELNKKYEEQNIAFKIKRIANGYIFATTSEFAKYIGYLSSERAKRRLSQAALETLSIIAYKQPITKPEVETIRGVNSDYMLTTLLEKNLITIKGRAETVGRPLLYATTDEFLKYFGINSISDLPKPRELEEIMQDEDFLEQKRKIMMATLEEKLEESISKSNHENQD